MAVGPAYLYRISGKLGVRKAMNIKLGPELERLIAEKVDSGEYRSADEVICKGLELLQEREKEKVHLPSTHDGNLIELFECAAREVPDSEWAKLPSDLASNVDRYLYGNPKTS